MSLTALLTSSLTVQRQTVTPDGGGGASRTWATRDDLPAAIPCRIQPAGWHLSRQFARDDSTVIFEVHTQVDLAATRQDRLIVDGVAYAVEAYRPQSPLPGTLAVFQTVVSKRN